ncbi:MAG: GDP-mannose 4,6-dehydratase [Bdellovibrionia bacterium]
MRSDSNRVALITGVSGQDGALLARLLLGKGYRVVGTSRDSEGNEFRNLRRLGIFDQVPVVTMSILEPQSIYKTLEKYQPSEIYHLTGQSSVSLSFEQPVETIESMVTGTLNLVEAARLIVPDTRIYNSSSSEIFGNTEDHPANENTPFKPCSPYGIAKAAAHNIGKLYREAYGLFISNGILFNHESILRPKRFVTQKIVNAARQIHQGESVTLKLGNLSISRDWGSAEEYVDVMWQILQTKEPEDFIIATGRTVSLGYFVEKCFAYFGLNWKEHVIVDESLLRPSDILVSRGDPSKAREFLGWKARTDVDGVIELMCKGADA